jgi:hypothetical protein
MLEASRFYEKHYANSSSCQIDLLCSFSHAGSIPLLGLIHQYESIDTVSQYNQAGRISPTITGRKTAIDENKKKMTAGSAK